MKDTTPIIEIEQNAGLSQLAKLLARVSESPQDYVGEDALCEVVRAIYYAEGDGEIKVEMIQEFIAKSKKRMQAYNTIIAFMLALLARIIKEQKKEQPQIPVEASIEKLPLAA